MTISGLPSLRNGKIDFVPRSLDEQEKTRDELISENEKLRKMAARYWVLRDTIHYHIEQGKRDLNMRVPQGIKLVFKRQMADIDEEIDS
ncbi:MAG: hypothetical protein ACTHJV_00900 [Rhizobiaceae bacterium]